MFPTKQGPRGAPVLDRLLALNHARYAEEKKAGLHDKGAKKPVEGKEQGELFSTA